MALCCIMVLCYLRTFHLLLNALWSLLTNCAASIFASGVCFCDFSQAVSQSLKLLTVAGREPTTSSAAMQEHVQALRKAQAHMFELSEQVSVAELATELAEARADFIERNSGESCTQEWLCVYMSVALPRCCRIHLLNVRQAYTWSRCCRIHLLNVKKAHTWNQASAFCMLTLLSQMQLAKLVTSRHFCRSSSIRQQLFRCFSEKQPCQSFSTLGVFSSSKLSWLFLRQHFRQV